MIKKLSLTVAAVAALLNVATAATWNGFYAGAQTGVSFITNDFKLDVEASNQRVGGVSSKKTKGVWVLDLLAGYTHKTASNLLVGAEILIGTGQETPKQKIKNNNGTEMSDRVHIKRSAAFGVGPRIGYQMNANWAAFLKAGLEFQKFQIEAFDEDGNPRTGFNQGFHGKKRTRCLFVPEAQVEYAMGSWILRGAIAYAVKQKVCDSKETAGAEAVNVTNKLSETRFKVGVVYSF